MPAWKRVIVSGSDATLTSVTATAGFTGSLFGTASFAQTASYVNPLNQQILLSGSLKFDPTQDPDPLGIDLDSTVLFQSSSNTALGYDLYVRQNGNLVKWKWIEGTLETGLLYGGVVTYSGSNVFVSPGSGIIADHNPTTGSEASPMIEYVTWNAITQSITNIATQQVTYLYIDNNGTLQQQSTRFTSQQYHDYIPLGAVGHFDYTQVSVFGGGVQTAYDQISQISNFIDAFGPLKMSGYGLTGQAGSLRLSVGSGTSFIHGGFYQNDPEFPSQITTPLQTTASMAYVYRSGSGVRFDTNGGNLYTQLKPGFYDPGTGVTGSVSNNDWTIQRAYSDPKTGVLYVYFGQNIYPDFLTAVANISADSFTEGSTFDFTTFVGFLILKSNETDITAADNKIVSAGLFRGSGQGSGGGIAISNLQDLTDVSIVGPTNGQALIYNSGTWVNGVPTSASFATQALSASYAPSTPAFPFTGSAQITGSLGVTGSFNQASASLASGLFAYAQGFAVTASGIYSHAEGQATIADGLYSHAEGQETSATGASSHAEGYATLAQGNYSHAEGRETTATGDFSHAEGNFTVASGDYQHVQGQFNQSSSAQSAFIVGNGTGTGALRSNLIFASGSQVQITGSVIATAGFTGSFTGSLFGGALTAVTASYVATAQNVTVSPSSSAAIVDAAGNHKFYPLFGAVRNDGNFTNVITYANSGSFQYIMGTNTLTVTSSYANQALSSSFAVSASRAVSSSFATTASFAVSASRAVSSSFATTASYATVAQTVLNESSFALLGSPNNFTSAQTITATLNQGNSTNTGTTKAYSCDISSGVVTLNALLYGDVTADFNVDDQLLIYDAPFDNNYGIITSKIASVIYDGFVTFSTIITLYDTSISTTTAYVGDLTLGVSNWLGDQTIPASYSHAEGSGTTTLGDYSHAEGANTNALGSYSHAEGNNTIAQGDYQHVQGAYNIASSAQSAFIVGNGTADGSRSNLIFASGSQVQITGSLTVSGSSTFTNIGPAVFSGSVASTAGFTGSLQGTASFALAVAGGGGGGDTTAVEAQFYFLM